MKELNAKIPSYVTRVTDTLQDAGFEAYLVGGCVRDLLMGRTPNDWDVTTNAVPKEIIGLFEKTFYENTYGTVGVVVKTDVSGETPENINPSVARLTLTPQRAERAINQIVPRETLRPGSGQATTDDVDSSASRRTMAGITGAEVSGETVVIEVTPYRVESKYSDKRHPDEVVFSKKLEDDLRRRDFTINALAYNPREKKIIDLYKGQDDIKDTIIRAIGKPEDRFNEDALRLLRAVRFSAQLGFTI